MRQRQALTVMLSGASVFLTGPPGAGKTYVLNEFVRVAERSGKRIAVTASTGIAATHIGGSTIHSWSGLGIREELNSSDLDALAASPVLNKRYISTDVLVIDEISMLHGKRLDMLDRLARRIREDNAPFGGMQVVLVGDLFQLPPVSRGYELVDFVHLSEAWKGLALQICYLTEQHRQGSDQLIDILDAMRRNELEEWHIAALKERLVAQLEEGSRVTRLYTHNIDVDALNQQHLAHLGGESKLFTMVKHGTTSKVEQLVRGVLAPEYLELKVGAEVMFVVNDFISGFVNGTRGQVVDLSGDRPLVRLAEGGKILTVDQHSWVLEEDGKRRAEIMQLPLRLAWAITIHKSQGMSMDAAEIDLSKSFTPGMGYVALSRVRSLKGIYLTGLNQTAMQLHPDIFALDARFRAVSAELAAQTEDSSDEAATKPVSIYNQKLLDKLRSWRKRRAAAEAVPAYVIAQDRVLEAIATNQPRNERQLLAISGIGLRKLELYGQDILQIILSSS